MPNDIVDAAAQALRIHRLLEQGGPLGVTAVARATGLTNSRCHRLLATLIEEGYVFRVPGDRRYHAAAGADSPSTGSVAAVLDACYPLLPQLRDASGETAHLGVLAGRHVYFLAAAESHQLMRVTSRAGARVPAHATAIGKALLAYRSDEQIRALFGGDPLAARTEHTIVDVDALLSEIRAARRLGYARNRAESEPGMWVLAVAIGAGNEQPAFAISLSGPEARINPRRTAGLSRRERELLALLGEAAGRLA